ncbi:MAG: hypothetical protein QE493_01130 [Verrucomicrobiae bacterium]|nr:hypothetical protein [Verrucomicrobiae bacterium]
MDSALISKSSSGSVYTHSRRQTSSPALPHQLSRPPRHDQYEISGLSFPLPFPYRSLFFIYAWYYYSSSSSYSSWSRLGL